MGRDVRAVRGAWAKYQRHAYHEPSPELAPCAGIYVSAGLRPHRFEVAAADGQLLLSIDEQPPLEFYPVAEGGFATTQANARLTFEAGRLVLVQEGVSTTAERL